MITPLPGATPPMPGSCTLPLPGHHGGDRRRARQPVTCADAGGFLVIKRPWPSMMRTIWGDPERYIKTYYPEKFTASYYLAGDGAHRDKDGYFWIMGRIDDVLNVVRPPPRHDGDRVGAGRHIRASPRPPSSAGPTTSRARRCSRSSC